MFPVARTNAMRCVLSERQLPYWCSWLGPLQLHVLILEVVTLSWNDWKRAQDLFVWIHNLKQVMWSLNGK